MQLPILAIFMASTQVAVPPDNSDYVPPTPGCNLSFIYFENGSANLSARARALLDQVVTARNRARFPSSFQLVGRADRVGSRRANARLAMRRVQAVRDYLSRSAPTPHFAVRADGEDMPPVETADGVAEPDNRVVEVLEIYAPEEMARIQEWHRVHGPWRGPVC